MTPKMSWAWWGSFLLAITVPLWLLPASIWFGVAQSDFMPDADG